MALEDRYHISFGAKTPLVIERGSGVYVWDTSNRKYLDFTAGWAVTSLGHAHPVIVKAISEQAAKIIQNPDSGLTYAPARAGLLRMLIGVMPEHLHQFFFTNSGAEANDAALKLARKITGRKKVVSTRMSFHGRTIGTTSATGQAIQRDRYEVLIPHHTFIPYNDVPAADGAVDNGTAAVIVEPIQGEGGVRVPSPGYLHALERLCRKSGALLIIDEIQTGFWRTGPVFASVAAGIKPDFITMAKGIAGGFPFGAVAVDKNVARAIEPGDHGGTFNGNPLGCAVASATIGHLYESDIEPSVVSNGTYLIERLQRMQERFPALIKEVRGAGLLVALEFHDPEVTSLVKAAAMANGLLLNLKHGTIIRIFPPLIIRREELDEGLAVLMRAVSAVGKLEKCLS
jgi:acetylornithine/N-succinyldiaminopimelate aminotransferase